MKNTLKIKRYKKSQCLIALLLALSMQAVLGARFGDWGVLDKGESKSNEFGMAIYAKTKNIWAGTHQKFFLSLDCVAGDFSGKIYQLVVNINPQFGGIFVTDKVKMKVDGGETIVTEDNLFSKTKVLLWEKDTKKIIRLANQGQKILVQARIVPGGVVIEEFSLEGFSEAFAWCNAP
ncbi:hypothetical protein [Candidatus Spongiihabitans sp.]|uniref:hypothetical protein n=1 Tax=Candidatus Spongiihabitans sp. TaxID=3101308 RepID=UPI003C6EE800